MMRRSTSLWAATVVACLLASASVQAEGGFDNNGQCVGDADGDDEVRVNELVTAVNNVLAGCELQPITIQFRAMVGDQAFACGTRYEGVGLSGSQFIPADLRFYLSDVQLRNAAGDWIPLRLDQGKCEDPTTDAGCWQVEDLVLLDFEDKQPPCGLGTVETNESIRGRAPAGEYNAIRFTLGIPFRLNHGDSATGPPPLSLSALFWDWQGGHKFMRVDTADDNYRIHLGSTGCASRAPSAPPTTRCARENRGAVVLDEFNPATQTIVADLGAALANSDLETNAEDTAPGCMSSPEDADCAPLMQNLGINFENGLPDPSRQEFFRVE